MTPDEILAAWERHHGPLTKESREALRTSDAVTSLTGLPDTAVQRALRRNKKLSDVLRDAGRLADRDR